VASDQDLGGRDALSIADFYAEVEDVLHQTFPRSREIWIRGELQKVTVARSGHAYFDLIDSDSAGDARAPVLSVNCWRAKWGPLSRELSEQGIVLEEGMSVTIRGALNFYAARGQVSLNLEEVDVEALLGRLARQRQELIDALRSDNLFDAQRRRQLSEVPLRVGLVGSPGTEGYKDFLGQCERSPFGFKITVARASVQGHTAISEVAGAIARLDDENLDVICVVRGGGSKADLAAFDAAPIAYAIATATTPVLTGIGHTGDESVADLVAHEAHITPTACGAALVSHVAAFWNHIAQGALRCLESAEGLMESEAEAHVQVRTQLVVSARRALASEAREVGHLRRTLVAAPGATLAREQALLSGRGERLLPAARRHLSVVATQLEGTRRLLSAFDPRRSLERGWTLTTDEQGQILRSVAEIAPGAKIITTMIDGSFDSRVESMTPEPRKGN
jgi:exodeoxyribonuclease VII large subunit